MAFVGVTFAGQNVTPKHDGGLYQAHHGDGILWGCSMSLSGDDLVIQSGEIILGGRVVQVDGATNVDLSGRQNTTGYIQVILNADLSQPQGSQWYTTFVESATTTFPTLTTDAINNADNLYQVELAVVQVSGGNLTSIYSSLGYSDVVSNGNGVFNFPSNGGNIRLLNNGVYGARVNLASSGNVAFSKDNSSGVAEQGIYLGNDDTVRIFGNGNAPVYIRPNGFTDNTGQVVFNTDGQQTGGHPVTTKTTTSNVSLDSSWKQITSITGLDSSGVYMVSCQMQYTAGQSTAHYMIMGFGSSTSNREHQQSNYDATTGARQYCISGLITGVTQVVFSATTSASAVTATASAGASIKLVRIN